VRSILLWLSVMRGSRGPVGKAERARADRTRDLEEKLARLTKRLATQAVQICLARSQEEMDYIVGLYDPATQAAFDAAEPPPEE